MKHLLRAAGEDQEQPAGPSTAPGSAQGIREQGTAPKHEG